MVTEMADSLFTLLQSLMGEQLVIKKSINLSEPVLQMIIVNEEVWCLRRNAVDVYNASTSPPFRTTITGFLSGTGIATTTAGLVVIATDKGLYLYSRQQLTCVSNEPHYSVATDGDEVVTLRGEPNKFSDRIDYIDRYSHSMSAVQTLKLQRTIACQQYEVTTAIVLGTMYICCSAQMYRVNYKTGHIHQITDVPMKCPAICSTDGRYLLMADTIDNNIQLFNCESEVWVDINTGETNISIPTSATVDNSRKLYIATAYETGYSLQILEKSIE